MIEAPQQQEDIDYRAHFEREFSKPLGGGIGFAGAHRTGKTSLCKALADANPGIPFVQTSTTAIAKAVGFDVNGDNTFEERLGFQEFVLLHYEALFRKQHTIFLTDRTPLDFAGYLLADVPHGTSDELTQARVAAYLDRCAALAEDCFLNIMVIQPGIPFVPAEGKPLPNTMYQEQLNMLMIGFANTRLNRPFYVINRGITDMGARVELCAHIIGTEIGKIQNGLSHLPRQ